MLSRYPKITRQVWDQIYNTIGCLPPESGGILGSSDGGKTIDYFFFDHSAHTTGSTYTPNTSVLNWVLRTWNAKGIMVCGFIHSHPSSHVKPSLEDIRYGSRIMRALNIRDRLYMPIVTFNDSPDGTLILHHYLLEKRLRVREIEGDVAVDYDSEPTDENLAFTDQLSKRRFQRYSSLFPLDVMQRKTVVCIGTGGAMAFVEELARCGVGRFVLIDGDTVSDTNIGTQQAYVSEIGRFKTDALRDRILDINPTASVTVVPRFMDNGMSDEEFASIIGEKLATSPQDILICGCTDQFHAQARTAALAMKYGTPYLAAQLYIDGMAAEVYFSYPGVTNSSCPRCALESRYSAYEKGYRNDITTDGAPIFATSRLNSLKGQIALMLLLYHEDESCVYSNMLDQVADRNFVMLRMSPLADTKLHIGVFKEAMREDSDLNFFDETVWIPQAPNDGANGGPVCPLCGGTGDLLALKGNITDTQENWGCGRA